MKAVRPTFFDVIMMLTTSSDKLCNGSNIPLFNHHPPSNFTYLFPHLRKKRLPLFYPDFSVKMLVFSYFMTSRVKVLDIRAYLQNYLSNIVVDFVLPLLVVWPSVRPFDSKYIVLALSNFPPPTNGMAIQRGKYLYFTNNYKSRTSVKKQSRTHTFQSCGGS